MGARAVAVHSRSHEGDEARVVGQAEKSQEKKISLCDNPLGDSTIAPVTCDTRSFSSPTGGLVTRDCRIIRNGTVYWRHRKKIIGLIN